MKRLIATTALTLGLTAGGFAAADLAAAALGRSMDTPAAAVVMVSRTGMHEAPWLCPGWARKKHLCNYQW